MEESKNSKIGICPYLNNIQGQNSNMEEKNNSEDYQKEIMLSHPNSNVSSSEKKCLFVKLKKDATYINLMSFYLVQFSYVCFFAFMDSMQPHLLEKKEGYINTDGYTDEDINKANYDLVFYDNLYLIVFISIFGSFHDVFGRKIICFTGFFLISLALLFYPYATWIYPNLLLLRLLFSNGVCAVTTQPLLADYVSHESKGYAGGITALLSGLGALFAVFGLMHMRSFVSIGGIYIIAAGISLFVAIFCLFGVRNVNLDNGDKTFKDRFVSIFTKLKQGTIEVASNFKLSIGVLTNAQARMNTIIITLFLNLWCKKYIIDKDEAYKTGMMLSGIGQVAGLISSVLFGFIFDKASYSTHLLINNSCIILGYVSLIFLEPSNKLCIISFCLVSIGYYGLMTVGYVIINRNVGHQARGSVMGINSFMGAVGIVFLTKLGGMMFDQVSSLSPFLICAITSALMIITMIIPYFNRKLNNEGSNSNSKDEFNYRKLSGDKTIESQNEHADNDNKINVNQFENNKQNTMNVDL